MTLQHAVLTAEVPLAEATVTNNQLRLLLAILEVTLGLLWCATHDWQDDVDCAVRGDSQG